VLVVAGNVQTEEVFALAEKWFGEIPAGEKIDRNIPAEVAADGTTPAGGDGRCAGERYLQSL
jgi:predicted Zn-dependent peptidase